MADTQDDDFEVDLAAAKKRLLELRAELLREGDVEIEPARKDPSDTGGDEDAQALNEMNQIIASKRNRDRTTMLGRIDRALRRLADDPDLFGLCSECEEPIGRRMELLPYVELCVACQEAKDGSPKRGSRRHLTDYR